VLRLPLAASVAAIVLGFVVLLVPMAIFPDAHVSNPLAATAIVLGVVAIEQTRGIGELPVLESLGDASYSLYLSHIFTLGLLRAGWAKVGWTSASGAVVFVALTMLACSLAAVGSYRLVEKPLTQYLINQWRTRKSRKAAALATA
jgi:exopolysaccharide production protein ExoZ